jgi:hypothetical protein
MPGIAIVSHYQTPDGVLFFNVKFDKGGSGKLRHDSAEIEHMTDTGIIGVYLDAQNVQTFVELKTVSEDGPPMRTSEGANVTTPSERRRRTGVPRFPPASNASATSKMPTKPSSSSARRPSSQNKFDSETSTMRRAPASITQPKAQRARTPSTVVRTINPTSEFTLTNPVPIFPPDSPLEFLCKTVYNASNEFMNTRTRTQQGRM